MEGRTPIADSQRKASAGEPQKWALLVGINHYKYGETYGVSDLRGCLNDVADVHSLLVGKLNFPEKNIKVLKDEQATRANILSGIESWLVGQAKPNDIVVFYYSGHGSEVIDAQRLNQRDQSIVPQDGRDPAGTIDDITGMDLNTALATLQTANSTFILDCCYSGSMRARRVGVVRSLPPLERKRAEAAQSRTVQTSEPTGIRPSRASYALLAACAPNELSIETDLGGQQHGLFTYFFCRELRRSVQPLTYRDLMDNLKSMVTSVQPDQHPQLEGANVDLMVFANAHIAPRPYLLVSPANANLVTLHGGREIGLTKGSRFEVYPPAAKYLGPLDPVLAEVEVIRVDDFAADGRIVSGRMPPPNSRAVEKEHCYEGRLIRICINDADSSPLLRQIREQLAALSHVQLVEGPCDLSISQASELIQVQSVVASAPVMVAAGPSAVDQTMQKIAAWSRWFKLLELTNDSSPLDVVFQIAAAQNEAGYFEESAIECTITNRSDVALYISILDFADDGSIKVIYPVNDPPLLYAGHTLQKSFELGALEGQGTSASDTLKLIASTLPCDFHIFEGTAIKGAPPPDGQSLSRFFLTTVFASGKDASQLIQTGTWKTVERSFRYHSRSSAKSMALTS